MKKFYFTFGAMLLAGSLAASAQSKLNLSALEAVNAVHAAASTPAKAKAMSAVKVPVSIGLVPGGDITALNTIEGLEISNHIGDVVLATVPVSGLEALAGLESVRTVEFPEEATPAMMHARISTFASKVQGNITPEDASVRPFTKGYLGRGVVVGLLDNGMDPNHISFYKAPDYKETRVKLIVQFDASGREVARWDTPEKIKAYTTEDEENPAHHGTHVLGIMSGAFNGEGEYIDYQWYERDSIEGRSNKDPQGHAERIRDHAPSVFGAGSKAPIPYTGMAPESDIVICVGPLNSNTELASAKAIQEYAQSVGKPSVINFSLGQNFGSCDGTDNFSREIAKIGEKSIVCISAGNDGNKSNWVSKTFETGDTKVGTMLQPQKNDTKAPGATLAGTSLEIWGSDERPFTVRLFIYDKDKASDVKRYDIGEFNAPGSKYFDTADRDDDAVECFIGLISVTGEVMAQNNRYAVKITLPHNFVYQDDIIDPVFGIELEGQPGQRVDLASDVDVLNLYNYGDVNYVNGDGSMSINNMACAKNVFAVAANLNRNIYGKLHQTDYSISGTVGTATHTATNFAVISGYGKLVDGRSLPTIAAPGYYVVSAQSRYYNNKNYTDYIEKTTAKPAEYTASKYGNNSAVAEFGGDKYYWTLMSGTSMASPAFAGICALWLEANPALTYKDIDEILSNTASLPKMKGYGVAHGNYKGGAWDETNASGFGMEHYNANKHRYGYGNVNAYEGMKYVLTHEFSGVSTVGAEEGCITVDRRGNVFEARSAEGRGIRMALVSLTGVTVAASAGDGNASLDASSAAKGIYILSVSDGAGSKNQKVIVR